MCDVFLGQAFLLPVYQTNGTMQHRKKYENQKALGENEIRFTKGEDFAKEIVVPRIRRMRLGDETSRLPIVECSSNAGYAENRPFTERESKRVSSESSCASTRQSGQ